MNVVFTILFAFAIGFFVKQRGLAILVYLALDAILFTFQTLSVLLYWMSDGDGRLAFGPAPTTFPVEYSESDTWGYGVVNLVIIAVGVGLVVLGTKVAARRAAKRHSVAVA